MHKRMQYDIWGKVLAMPNLPRASFLITAMKTTHWLLICRHTALTEASLASSANPTYFSLRFCNSFFISASSNSESLSLLMYDECEWKDVMLMVGIFVPCPLGESRPGELALPDLCRKAAAFLIKSVAALLLGGESWAAAAGCRWKGSSAESLEPWSQRTSTEEAVCTRRTAVFRSGLEGSSSK